MMNWKDAPADTLAAAVKHGRFGLVTDMDGTISPIVDNPEAAFVPPEMQALLRDLQPKLALVAVVSGRAVADVQQRVQVAGLVYVGSHGLETIEAGVIQLRPEAAAYKPTLERAKHDLAALIPPTYGVYSEDKPISYTIHYRQTADPVEFEQRWKPQVQAIAERHGLKLVHGRKIFELKPPVAFDKGSIFAHLVEAHQLSGAVFIGDDTTDADALSATRRLRASGRATYGIGVESPEMPEVVRTAADFTASSVPDVGAFLSWLLGLA